MKPLLGRRRFLTLVAVTPLAGCSGQLPGAGPERVDGDRLRQMARQDAPSVPETLPVAIEASFITGQTDHARALLAGVPGPFDSDEIPNGAIRERLNHGYEHARQRISGVDDAITPFERLEEAGGARVDAREVGAAWQAIDAGLTVDAVRESAPDIREDLDAFASQWFYVGDDPVRAVRVHAELERDIRGARTWVSVDERERYREGDGPFGVGDVAEDLERARVNIATATHVFDRFRESLDEVSDLEPLLYEARRGLRTRVRQRSRTLPDVDVDESPSALVDRDVGQTAGVWALQRLYRVAGRSTRGSIEAQNDEPSLANDILGATRTLALIQAFEHLRSRIEEGEDFGVSTAADVVALREAAIEAINAAHDADRAPILTRGILPRFARHLEYADHEFEHRSGALTVTSVERDAAEYVVAAETSRALPDVAAEVAAVLHSS